MFLSIKQETFVLRRRRRWLAAPCEASHEMLHRHRTQNTATRNNSKERIVGGRNAHTYNMSTRMDVDVAIAKIQRVWRSAVAWRRVLTRRALRRELAALHVARADRNEAALSIQTQIRRTLAKKRVDAIREERAKARLTASNMTVAQVAESVWTLSDAAFYLPNWRRDPTSALALDEVEALFRAVDVRQRHELTRAQVDAVCRRLVPSGLVLGDERRFFDGLIPVPPSPANRPGSARSVLSPARGAGHSSSLAVNPSDVVTFEDFRLTLFRVASL